MALAPLVKGASGRRPVFEPWTGIRGALQYGEVCPSQDSARFSEGKNLANRDEESFVLHRGAAALRATPAYSYIDAWRTPVLNGRPGSFHASEIAFTFDNAEICDHYSCGVPEAFVLSKQISNARANFARTGNPSHSGLPRWPAYRSERCAMYLDALVMFATMQNKTH
jgi:carboxylesterase type B